MKMALFFLGKRVSSNMKNHVLSNLASKVKTTNNTDKESYILQSKVAKLSKPECL